MNIATTKAEWVSAAPTNPPNKNYYLNQANILAHIDWIVRNHTIAWLQSAWVSTKGVPQGGQCSGAIARLFLISQERNFILHCLSTNPVLAFAFSNTFREMDDVISFNNPYFHTHILSTANQPGVYNHNHFQIEFQQPIPTHAGNYLQLFVHIIENTKPIPAPNFNNMTYSEMLQFARANNIPKRGNESTNDFRARLYKHYPIERTKALLLNTKTYHKYKKFPIHTISYPHWSSNIKHSIFPASITGLLHSLLSENLLLYDDFLSETILAFNRLIKFNAYPRNYLISIFVNFINKFPTLYYRPRNSILKLFHSVYKSKINLAG